MAEENKMFQVEIICPDRIFYQGTASMIEMNTVEGEIGVYKNHIPLTSVLAPGIVTITEADGEKEAAVHEGFVEILQDKVTILAEVAEWPGEIDLNRAQEAKDRAEERLDQKLPGTDLQRAEIALRKALVRLDIKK